MVRKWNKINKIKEMFDKGERSIESILKEVKIKPSTFYNYCCLGNVIIPGDIIPYRIESIDNLIDEEKTRKEISELTGHSYSSISHYLVISGQSGKVKRTKAGRPPLCEEYYNKRIENVKRLISEGERSIEKLCEAAGNIKPGTLRNNYGIKLPEDIIPYERKGEDDGKVSDIDNDFYKMVKEGKKLKEIAERMNITRERVRQRINEDGYYKLWKSKRREIKINEKIERINERILRQNIVYLLKEKVMNSVKENKAVTKALEYYFNWQTRKVRREFVPINKLVKMFDKYYNIIEGKERGSLESIEDYAGMGCAGQVGLILKKVGLKPPHGHLDIHRTKKEQKEIIFRAADSQFNSKDIAYFAGVQSSVVLQYYCKYGLFDRKFKRAGMIKPLAYLKTPGKKLPIERISYREASEIYEARDAGFKSEEICEIADVDREKLEIIEENRKNFEPKIIDVLRYIYADNSIEKPYKRNIKNLNYVVTK